MASAERELDAEVARIAKGFAIAGRVEGIERIGRGHIHDTFAVHCAGTQRAVRFVLQRINERVFKAPLDVMHNIALVTEHLRGRLESEASPDAGRRCLELIPARDGAAQLCDDRGRVWRVYRFVEDSVALDRAPSETQAFEAAWAFGDFVARLADLEPARLRETIPGFHDLDARVDALGHAVTRNAGARDLASLREDIRHAREAHARIRGALDSIGSLPRRVVHNDCKLNNVLLDARTGRALCVIDLDTVMEGTLLADFGDLVRTAATHAAEDERDLALVDFDLRSFGALARGYVAGLGDALAAEERAALSLAGPALALENAVRFLTDHLDGDLYFQAERDHQNLDRARCQLRLFDVMIAHLQDARDLIDAAAASSATLG